MAVAYSSHPLIEPHSLGHHRFFVEVENSGPGSLGAMSEGVSPLHPPSTTDSTLESHIYPPPPGQSGNEPTSANNSLKKRKLSKSKVPLELRRATSTPHIRGLAMTDAGPISPSAADKRRNKLGYHRTSVACGHCRRRKIRCLLPSPEDPQGRCANCIRLKKECVFYPVTEAAQHEPRPSKKGSTVGGSGGGSSTSPRANVPSNQSSIDDSQNKGGYLQPVRQLQSAAPADGFTTPQPNGAPFYPPSSYPYPGLQGSETWSPTTYTSPNAQQPQDSVTPYWTSSQIPESSTYQTSPPSAMGPPSAAGVENPNFAYSQAAQNWPQPRSLSLSHIEQAPRRYSYQDPAHEQQPHGHTAHLPYPSPVSNQGQPRASSGDHFQPTAPSHSTYPYPPQHWQGYPPAQPYGHEPSHPEYSGQWYAEPSALSRTDEAHEPGAPYAQQSAYYTSTSHPG